MRTLAVIFILFIVLGRAYADITFIPTCIPGDVLIDTVEVADETISGLLSGSYILEPADTGILPAGLYMVVIEGIGEEELVRQVVVLP